MYKVNVVMRQHNICCACVLPVWRGRLDCIPLHTGRTHAHTSYVMLPHHHN